MYTGTILMELSGKELSQGEADASSFPSGGLRATFEARQTSILAVGARLTVEGRIQSRTYTKNLETGPQERVAYEVSVMRPAELSEFVE